MTLSNGKDKDLTYTSYDDVVSSLERLARRATRVSTPRIDQLIRVIRALHPRNRTEGTLEELKLLLDKHGGLEDTSWALAQACELKDIEDNFGEELGSRQNTLYRMVKGEIALRSTSEKALKARETAFEVFTATWLRMNGVPVHLPEDTSGQSDVLLTVPWRDEVCQIECKRPRKHKGVSGCIDEAKSDLARRGVTAGIVALDLTPAWLSATKGIEVLLPQQVDQFASEAISRIFDDQRAKLCGSNIVAAIVTLRFPFIHPLVSQNPNVAFFAQVYGVNGETEELRFLRRHLEPELSAPTTINVINRNGNLTTPAGILLPPLLGARWGRMT